MKIHGLLTTAEPLDRAFARCLTLERCSKVYLKTLSIGSPNILSADKMMLARKQKESYEQKRRAFKAVEDQN